MIVSLSPLAALSGMFNMPSYSMARYRAATPSRRRTRLKDETLPRGYPGAKLARKAIQHRLGMATIR